QHLVREERGFGVVVLQEALHERGVVGAVEAAEVLVLAADDLPLAHLEQHADGYVVLTVNLQREEVAVDVAVGDDLLPLGVLPEGGDAVAQLGGLLELLRSEEHTSELQSRENLV